MTKAEATAIINNKKHVEAFHDFIAGSMNVNQKTLHMAQDFGEALVVLDDKNLQRSEK